MLVNAAHPKSGLTPLFALPDDDDEAVEMTMFLLAYGADPNLKNKDGVTPEQAAQTWTDRRRRFDAWG